MVTAEEMSFDLRKSAATVMSHPRVPTDLVHLAL